MPYPTGEGLAAWMVAQRLLAAAPEDLVALDLAAESAAEGWEGDTRWAPFLAGEDDETRVFDGPGGDRLFLGGGLLSISSLKVGGAALGEGEYWPSDRKAGRLGFQTVTFAGWVAPAPRVVAITGRFGLVAELPADVRLAILSKAAAGISTDSTSTGALKRETAGPVEYEYDVAGGATTKTATLLATYDACVARYRRLV